jgi:hypothetical protein
MILRARSKKLREKLQVSRFKQKGAVDLMGDGIIKKTPTAVNDRYIIFALDSATGVIYITPTSPQYVSGHLRLRGNDNGRYPYRIKELIEELFGCSNPSGEEIEVCSGEVVEKSNLVTVDINPAKNPSYVLDGQHLPQQWTNRFDIWSCDPPYSEHAAKDMYGTNMPSIIKLLTEGARVTKSGGLLFFTFRC